MVWCGLLGEEVACPMLVLRRACVGALCALALRPFQGVADDLQVPTNLLQQPFEEFAVYRQRVEEEQAANERRRSAALKPNRYGTLSTLPDTPPAPPSPRVMDLTGRLAPEFEGDTRVRYSNPRAERLAEVAATRPDFRVPDLPSAPIRRDGLLSIKPANLLCDDDGRVRSWLRIQTPLHPNPFRPGVHLTVPKLIDPCPTPRTANSPGRAHRLRHL